MWCAIFKRCKKHPNQLDSGYSSNTNALVSSVVFYDLQKKSAKIDKKNEEVAKSERRGMWTDDPVTISNKLDELYRQGTINKSFYDKTKQQLFEWADDQLRFRRASETLDQLEDLVRQIDKL